MCRTGTCSSSTDTRGNIRPLLEFQHIVQVNDLSNTSLSVLTRHQLWQGLVMRARFPDKFNHSLQCQSDQIVDNAFFRTIEVGDSSFRERVVLTPQEQIKTCSVPDADQIHAESLACIEDAEAGYLFVRFTYRRELEDRDERVDIAEHLKAAYVQVDRDAIAMIRLLAESSLFDETIN